MALTRRTFFEATAAATLGFAAIYGSRFACRLVPRNHPDFFSLLEDAPDGDAALRIGRLALAHEKLPSRIADLEAALRARPLMGEAIATGCRRTRAELVQAQCAADFREGRTLELDGWLLSETEAAICAAKALGA